MSPPRRLGQARCVEEERGGGSDFAQRGTSGPGSERVFPSVPCVFFLSSSRKSRLVLPCPINSPYLIGRGLDDYGGTPSNSHFYQIYCSLFVQPSSLPPSHLVHFRVVILRVPGLSSSPQMDLNGSFVQFGVLPSSAYAGAPVTQLYPTSTRYRPPLCPL